jgi:maltooligosyltrehalose synthase
VIAFARRSLDQWVIAVVPRRPSALVEVGAAPLGDAVWNESALALPEAAPTTFTNALTGEVVTAENGGLPLAHALATLPVALLVS